MKAVWLDYLLFLVGCSIKIWEGCERKLSWPVLGYCPRGDSSKKINPNFASSKLSIFLILGSQTVKMSVLFVWVVTPCGLVGR
jgi:hypothetical protein